MDVDAVADHRGGIGLVAVHLAVRKVVSIGFASK